MTTPMSKLGFQLRLRTLAQSCVMLGAFVSGAGCLSGGGMSLVAIMPTTAQTLDAGQSLTITASVVNDSSGAGASFSISGPGTLSSPTTVHVAQSEYVSVTYTAPATVTATTTVTITATSGNTPSATASVTITLNLALSITTTTLPTGTVGTAYSAAIGTAGGTAALKYSVASGSLPSGVTLHNTTGVLSGMPTAYGTFTFSIAVTDSASAPTTVTQSYSLSINPQPPTVTPSTLANGTAGSAYSQQLAYTGGGSGTPTFLVASGGLPSGITLSTSGLLSGMPANSTAGNTYTFNVTVTVGTQTSVPTQFSITIYPLPVVTITTLPSGNIGIAYSKQLSYSGGNGGAVSWAIMSGSLPANSGLTLSTSGLISGKPTTATTYNFSVAVTVGPQTSAPQALSLTINSLVITSGSSASGEVGLPFSFHLTAQGGTGPYTWSLAAGSAPLPSPLTLNASTGVISGTPTTSVNSPFTGIVVMATDSLNATATQGMTFTINPAASTVQNSLLTGNYPFLLSGFDSNGKPLVVGGVFTANGAGAITGGVTDRNGTSLAAAVTNTAITGGSYSVGSDNRGRLVLTTASSTSTYVLALNSGATSGYLTEFDASGQSLSGVFGQQTSTAALSSSGFAFGAGGFAANSTVAALTHRALAGEFQTTAVGGYSAAEYLSSSSISATPTVPTGGNVTVGALGRGTLSFTKPSGGTLDFIVYEVTPSQLYLFSSDAASGSTGTNDLVSGTALKQTIATGSFNAASLNGTSVMRSESLLATSSSGAAYLPDVLAGLYTFNGTGVATLSADENAGGTVGTRALGGSYTIASNGRVTATLSSGLSGCLNCIAPNETFFYLTGANQGYIMDFSRAAFSGFFEPQTATGITNASFSGTYAIGSLNPLSASVTLLSGAVNSGGAGSATGTEDENSAGTLTPDATLSATYLAAASGRATFTPAAGDNSVLYIVSPTKAVLLDITTPYPVVNELQH